MQTKKAHVWAEYLLFIAGCSTLAYCASMVLVSNYYQARTRQQMQKSEAEMAAFSVPSHTAQRSTPEPLRVDRGFALVGRIEVPRLHLSAMVAEGDTPRVLRVAVGHLPGTPLPWQSGNMVLAAHRDTFFRHLGDIKQGDLVRITIPGSEYTYRVTFTDVVEPQETWVLRPATGETLTLITCYPFQYIGPAPKRFVVRARRPDFAN